MSVEQGNRLSWMVRQGDPSRFGFLHRGIVEVFRRFGRGIGVRLDIDDLVLNHHFWCVVHELIKHLIPLLSVSHDSSVAQVKAALLCYTGANTR
jgi:hypothetical protein